VYCLIELIRRGLKIFRVRSSPPSLSTMTDRTHNESLKGVKESGRFLGGRVVGLLVGDGRGGVGEWRKGDGM
jgi:hypothetical protein